MDRNVHGSIVSLNVEVRPVLGALVRRFGHFYEAEEALQEALLSAALQWPLQGQPQNPQGWLYRVAARKMIDALRQHRARKRRELQWEVDRQSQSFDEEMSFDKDDPLRLLFLCTYPSLSAASAVALTLRAVVGLSTEQIAAAFLVPESTMAQRILRAKSTIRTSRIPFEIPEENERKSRLQNVLKVLYLMFNEGYVGATGNQLVNADMAAHAIELTRELTLQLSEESETIGLLALMLLTEARRGARTDDRGRLVPLERQDRTQWNRTLVEEGTALLKRALTIGNVGPYQIQAAIAALHDEAENAEVTDWNQIVALYSLLEQMTDNPVVVLNRAIAVSMVQGSEVGLKLVEDLEKDARMKGHFRLDAAKAHFLEKLGRHREAAHFFERAAGKSANLRERDYLVSQAVRLRSISS